MPNGGEGSGFRVQGSAHSAIRGPQSAILFVVLWFSYAYFAPGPGWGSVSRLNLVMALIDQGTLRLDAYRGTTGDRAQYPLDSGRYFHEKAPGGAILGLLPYRLFSWVVPRPAMEVMHKGTPVERWDPAWSRYYGRALYATTCFTTALLSAAAGVVLFRLAWGLYGDALAALLTTLIYGLGTMVLVYAGQFQSHQMAGALVVFGLYLAWQARNRGWKLAGAGLCLGYAVATEYQDIFLLTCVGVYLFATLRPRRRVLWFLLGALPPLGMVLIYNHLCFGNPFRTGYAYVDAPGWQALHKGPLLGLGAPRAAVLARMLVDPGRGLFIFSPAFLLAIPGAVLWWRGRRHRAELLLSLAVCALFPIYLSGFKAIETGHQFGPRFLVPMLPLAALLMVPAVMAWRKVAVGVGVVSCLFALSGAAVNPEFPPSTPNPITSHLLPSLLCGNFPQQTYGRNVDKKVTRPIEYKPFNLGMKLGLTDLPSLVPLILVWGVGIGLAVRWVRPRPACAP